jgi:purine-binding chemotaxis protein CheW
MDPRHVDTGLSAVGLPAALYLLCRIGRRVCALPIEHAGETMRPLPVEPMAGTPGFVRGAALIRGVPTPVVDLCAILGGAAAGAAQRFVTLRLGERSAALLVDEVIGVRRLAAAALAELPPLLAEGPEAAVAWLGAIDGALLLVLQAGRMVPDAVWEALDRRAGAA